MSSTLLKRAVFSRAITNHLTHHPVSTSTQSLSSPANDSTTDSTTVSTAVSILTHHRSKSRWSTLLSLFPRGFTPPQLSQTLLQIRNNPHLALRFFNFITRHFRSLSSPTLHCYATIIHILARARQKARSQTLIKEAIRASNGLSDGQRCELFKVLVETYRVCDSAPFVFDLLIRAYLDMNNLDPSIYIFRKLKSRRINLSVGTCNALISCALKCKGCYFGYDLYKEVFVCDDQGNDDEKNTKKGGNCKVVPNVHTFNELMISFHRAGELDMLEEVWIEMVKANCSADCYSYSILMEAYCEEGGTEKARNVWEEMIVKGLKPDVVAYNTLIGGYCKIGEVERGEELYREMVMRGLTGTVVTFQHLVNGYCLAGDADSAVLVYKDMHRTGFHVDRSVVDSMVRVLCDKKSVAEALEFFRIAMDNADFVAGETSYELLIKGLCGEGKMDEALKLQAQMVGKGFGPNPEICGAFIDGYMKHGELDVAERLRKEMMTT